MKLTRLVGVAAILGSLSIGALQAQTTAPGSTPAEFPPNSYSGKQYVDSKGCVFIRAGIDGTVTWIPRVGRDRKGVCGFKPTFAGRVTEVTTTPIPEETVEITNSAPATVAAARPAPRPQVVRQTAPKRAPRPAVIAQAPVVVAPPVALPAGRGGSCAGASALSQRYINDGSRYPVRCGPQSKSIIGARIGVTPPARKALFGKSYRSAPITVSPQTRIVPRHVAIRRANTANVVVPEGFQSVWEDDRLNPYRAEQTLAGIQSMKLIWTSTVPRRLINHANKRDVTASIPLVYPYTDVETQLRDLGVVTIEQRSGQTVKRIVRNPGTPTPVYSSRSAPDSKTLVQPAARAKVLPKASGYVNVATYGTSAEAQRMAKLVRRMGLQVQIGRYERGNQTYRIVIAGPFAAGEAAQKAVRRLQAAGFGGASPRN